MHRGSSVWSSGTRWQASRFSRSMQTRARRDIRDYDLSRALERADPLAVRRATEKRNQQFKLATQPSDQPRIGELLHETTGANSTTLADDN